MQVDISRVTKDNKIFMLAYDQGFEHGPTDFNEKNYDPRFILDIAKNGGFTCVAMLYGLASKFWQKGSDVPLIAKLNSKTNMKVKALSRANATVAEAIALGASGVGYTIHLGSEYEAEMIAEFGRIRKEAHDNGLLVFAWMYPFITPPSSNDDELQPDVVAHAGRVGAELGADVVKIKYPNDESKLPWIIKNAVGTHAVMSGGDKSEPDEFLRKISVFMQAGGAGLAVGRNVWQDNDPISFSKKIHNVIFPQNDLPDVTALQPVKSVSDDTVPPMPQIQSPGIPAL